jgi:hypothetical protein
VTIKIQIIPNSNGNVQKFVELIWGSETICHVGVDAHRFNVKFKSIRSGISHAVSMSKGATEHGIA